MNILVLGGAGFMGPHVIRKLVADGHVVTLFTRGNLQPELPAGIRRMTGDYKKLPEYRERFQGVEPEVVLDMIPITEQDALTVVATFRGIARRVVAASSQDVYLAWGYVTGLDRGPVDPHVNEDSPLRESRYPYRGRNLPIYTEWDLENYDKILVERAFQSDPELPATILRLPMVYGPGDPAHRTFQYLKRMGDGRTMVPIEQSAARWRGPLGYVEDVGAAIALAVASRAATGRVYNIAEPDVRSTADFIREIGQAAGWSGQIVELPKGALPGPWDAYRTEQQVITDSERIRRELGYRETVSRAEALRRTIEWERAHPPDPLPAFDYAAEDRALAEYVGSAAGQSGATA
jgi:nucleoside-diphosphate-sugar epimerase